MAYVLLYPDKTQQIAGWIWRGIAMIWGTADRKAVAYTVQGDVNTARDELVKNAPGNVIERKLKVRWANPEQAHAHIREGDVVVFMRKSRHREENVTNAVMAYLPRAVLPRARRYVDRNTMRAVDLTLARSILQISHMPTGALDVFFEKHLEPALAQEAGLDESFSEVDAIDLHGWLTRVMLAEFRAMGDRLYPGECDEVCLQDAREFCRWLGRLATEPPRAPGERPKTGLVYRGRYLNTAITFVAMKGKIAAEGLEPYRKRVKRMIYAEKVDVVYLMARDDNIRYVKELRDVLRTDAIIDSVATYEYRLRSDFKARIMNRERAICVVLRRRRVDETPIEPPEDLEEAGPDDEVEVYDFELGVLKPDRHDEEAVRT